MAIVLERIKGSKSVAEICRQHKIDIGWIYLVLALDWYRKKIVGHGVFLRGRTAEWGEL